LAVAVQERARARVEAEPADHLAEVVDPGGLALPFRERREGAQVDHPLAGRLDERVALSGLGVRPTASISGRCACRLGHGPQLCSTTKPETRSAARRENSHLA